MNTQKKIEQCLRAAPKPAAPDGLLNRLQEDVAAVEIKKRVTIIRRWFAPANGSISLWRVAAAAAIAIVVLLPLSYGATMAIKHFIVFEAKFEYPQDDEGVHGYGNRQDDGGVHGYGYRRGSMYGVKVGIASSDPNFTEEDARKVHEEFYKLYKEGKVKEVEPGVWEATRSDGSRIRRNINPELFGLSDAERNEFLKKQFDEIHELRKAGKFERTFIKEIEKNGVKIRLYEDRFTLSNGKVIKIGAGEGESVKDENED